MTSGYCASVNVFKSVLEYALMFRAYTRTSSTNCWPSSLSLIHMGTWFRQKSKFHFDKIFHHAHSSKCRFQSYDRLVDIAVVLI